MTAEDIAAARATAIDVAAKRIRSALRQEERLQGAWRKLQPMLPAKVLDAPPQTVEFREVRDQFNDEIYYFLLAAHHALVTSRLVLAQVGVTLPAAPSSVIVEKLRDLYEHWEAWYDSPSLRHEDPKWGRKKSGKYLKENYPNAWPNTTTSRVEGPLEGIGGVLDLNRLRQELETLHESIRTQE